MTQALRALRFWGVRDCRPRLIKNRENAVFEVTDTCGNRAALRLHRPGYQSDAAIRSELTWCEGLAKAGLAVPRPVPTLAGDVIAPGGRVASMVAWCEGVPMGEGGVPLAWGAEEQIRLYHGLGEELARLHEASDALDLPPQFSRVTLDEDALLGDNPVWGRFWENPALSAAQAKLLQDARIRLREILTAHRCAGGDFGLIHADALRENVFVRDGAVSLIDFDDGGFGFRLYDLGVAMSQNWDAPNARHLALALLQGYCARRPISAAARALLPAFTTLRALAYCGWVIGRYPPDSAATRDYGARAVAAARIFLEGKSLFGA